MRRLPVVLALLGVAVTLPAQDPGMSVGPFDQKHGGSKTMQLLAHVVSNPGAWKASDIEMEQDPGRPYVYISGFTHFNVQIYDVRDEQHPKEVWTGRSRTPNCTAASARWIRSTSRSATSTTSRSRTSSCRAVPTPIWAR